MKKIILISLMILAICLVGCEEKKTEEVVVDGGESQIENTEDIDNNENNVLNMSFEERTKEAVDYMNKTYEHSVKPYWVNDSSQQNLIDNASLEKKDDYYLLKIIFVSPKIYDNEEIENAYNLAQENGTYTYDGYTFYKDNKVPMSNENYQYYDSTLANYYDFGPENYYISTKNFEWGEELCVFEFASDDTNNFSVSRIGINEGSIIYEFDKELEVVLLPNDIMTITSDRDFKTDTDEELTVEEYYQKAVNSETSLEESVNEFQYRLDSIGNSTIPWGVSNAVNFENGRVNVSYHFGGI